MGAWGEPSFGADALAGMLWLLLGVVSGWLIIGALDPARSRLDRWAEAPLVSVAVAFVTASWTQVWGLREPVWVVVSALGLASVGSVFVLVRRRERQSPWVRRPVLPSGQARLILLAAAVSVGLWAIAIQMSTPGWSAVVPNSDGNSHGILLSRILMTGSVDPFDVNAYRPHQWSGERVVLSARTPRARGPGR